MISQFIGPRQSKVERDSHRWEASTIGDESDRKEVERQMPEEAEDAVGRLSRMTWAEEGLSQTFAPRIREWLFDNEALRYTPFVSRQAACFED